MRARSAAGRGVSPISEFEQAEFDEAGFQRLLVRARDGDERAFAVLWHAYNPGVVRFLTGLAGRDDGADLASAVWFEIVRDLDRFGGDISGFRGWLFTTARRRHLDFRRGQVRRLPTEQPGEGPDPAAERSYDPSVLAEARWSTDAAVALIGSLAPDQAEVLLLRVVADLDVETVARVVGKRPGTVRVLAHRGLRRLAARLDAEDFSLPRVTH